MAEPDVSRELTGGHEGTPGRALSFAFLIALLAFAAVAPTLRWSEFAYGVEKLNIATALELRRASIEEGGVHWRTWLVPTLEGESRVRKPPMNAWVTALSMRPETVSALSSPDAAVRERASRDLAWQSRWQALAHACLALVAIYLLGKTVADETTGLLAAAVAASTLYFVRFSRLALTDVPLFFWVTLANVFVARAVLRGRWWGGCMGAGIALGFAMMNKGPVCLLQSVLPALAFVAWKRWHSEGTPSGARERRILPPVLAGLLLFLVVGGAWFVFVSFRNEGTGQIWWKEVTRTDEVEKATGTRLDYLSIFGFLMPWTIFFVGGLMEAGRRLRRNAAGSTDLVLMLFMVVVPIVVMTCFRDRKERYLIPLLGPASVLIASSVVAYMRRPTLPPLDLLGVRAHWAMLLLIGPGMAVAGATTKFGLVTRDARPWFSTGTAALIAVASVLVVAAGAWFGRRHRASIVVTTFVVVLVGQLIIVRGYTRSPGGTSEMKPLAAALWITYPDVEPYNLRGDGRRKMAPNDLSIYLNRVTKIVPGVEDIPTSKKPQLYTELWDRPDRDPEPVPAAGWTFFQKVPRGEGWWYAFVRTPAAD